MNDTLIIAVFFICVTLIVYHHLGHPLFLKWYSKRHPLHSITLNRQYYIKSDEDSTLPSISILVPAYNEERWISEKIRNLASIDYPRDKLKIYIICDGCQDRTAEFAGAAIQDASCADTLFKIIESHENLGKVARLNQFIPRTKSDLVALSDVSALISIDALYIAAEHFKNPNMGVVNPSYQLFDQSNPGENKYWNYQCSIKKAEASLGSTIGSHGAFYIFRQNLFSPLAANTINDDFVIPMKIVQQGYTAHYDNRIVALELEPTDPKNDFKRRLRISAGNMQQILILWRLFNPRKLGVAVNFFSGKGLRLLTPYLMLTCFFCTLLLNHYILFHFLLIAQIVIYLGAIFFSFIPFIRNTIPVKVIVYLLLGHLANFLGGLRYLSGQNKREQSRINS